MYAFYKWRFVHKWLTQLCRCLCWWNPLVYKMQDTLEKNLEIRCDLTVTENLSQKEQLSYLGTIVKTLKNAQKKETAVFCTESIWQIKMEKS